MNDALHYVKMIEMGSVKVEIALVIKVFYVMTGVRHT